MFEVIYERKIGSFMVVTCESVGISKIGRNTDKSVFLVTLLSAHVTMVEGHRNTGGPRDTRLMGTENGRKILAQTARFETVKKGSEDAQIA